MGEAEAIVDAEVVPDAEELEATSSVELVAAPPQTAIITAEDPDEILAKAGKIAKSLTDLVQAQGFAVQMGGKKPHLEIGAWQALGALLGALGGQPLHSEVVWSKRVTDHEGKPERTTYHVHEKKWTGPKGQRVIASETEYDVEGCDWEACVEVKMPNGLVVGRAEAMCSRAESSWMSKADPALKSMAETRAASRAFRHACGWIVAIAGYNPTPAEEMPTPLPAAPAAGPPFGEPVNDTFLKQTRNAVAYLFKCDADDMAVTDALTRVMVTLEKKGWDGAAPYVPFASAAGIAAVATEMKIREQAPPGEGDPTAETAEERKEREDAEAIVERAENEMGGVQV
jgi:hypothetical protein